MQPTQSTGLATREKAEEEEKKSMTNDLRKSDPIVYVYFVTHSLRSAVH
jgi:hypothetical protein